MVDYKILEDIPHYGQDRKDLERRYMCASLGLFYVRGNGDLMPIAIQFHQDPHHDNPIWTPNDSEVDWICAKLWLRNSDTQFHQVKINTPCWAKTGHSLTALSCLGSFLLLWLSRTVILALRVSPSEASSALHYGCIWRLITFSFLLADKYVKVAEPWKITAILCNLPRQLWK